jgi:hypothetical protein
MKKKSKNPLFSEPIRKNRPVPGRVRKNTAALARLATTGSGWGLTVRRAAEPGDESRHRRNQERTDTGRPSGFLAYLCLSAADVLPGEGQVLAQ